MALDIGPGLDAWCQAHQATPLAGEVYPWGPDLPVSVLPVEIADADGNIVHTVVGWCNNPENMGVLEPGPGIVYAAKSPAVPDIPAVDVTSFQVQLQIAMGWPVEVLRSRMIDAWARCEGGASHNNPLNVAAPLDGSWRYAGQTGFWNNLGTMGVVNLATPQHGVDAAAKVLAQANMSHIRNALQAQDVPGFLSGLATDPWGTGVNCVSTILGR